MVKTVRLPQRLESRLARAAQIEGLAASEIIRRALERYCDTVLASSARERLADVIGAVRSSGGRARDTGTAFRRILRERRK